MTLRRMLGFVAAVEVALVVGFVVLVLGQLPADDPESQGSVWAGLAGSAAFAANVVLLVVVAATMLRRTPTASRRRTVEHLALVGFGLQHAFLAMAAVASAFAGGRAAAIWWAFVALFSVGVITAIPRVWQLTSTGGSTEPRTS